MFPYYLPLVRIPSQLRYIPPKSKVYGSRFFMAIIIDSEPRPLDMIDLASNVSGGQVLWSTDDFFAAGENLLKPEPAVFDPDRYTERGKWMDGWESRRRRTPGHDTAIIKLGIAGIVRMVNINTAHFTGNYPAFGRVWGCHAPDDDLNALRTQTTWFELTNAAALKGGASNMVVVRDPKAVTHVKLEIFPAGGVARLRVYGDAVQEKSIAEVNLIGQETGAQAIACSDMYFSEMHNLLKATPAANMGDGWETKRSRPPGDDWVIIKLGHSGIPSALEVDTAFFKGNYPQQFSVEALMWPGADPWQLLTLPLWTEVLGKTNLGPDQVHRFDWPTAQTISHIRVRIYPDGGISRLRLFGRWCTEDTSADDSLNRFNQINPAERTELLSTCCGATRWIEQMLQCESVTTRAHLRGLCESMWWSLDEADWLEAFTHHPKIGEDKAALQAKFAGTATLCASEQQGIESASEAILERLIKGNQTYLEKFGFIFIVCAQGKSAQEMCTLLEERLVNSRENELRIAAGEQAKITWLRIEKCLNGLIG